MPKEIKIPLFTLWSVYLAKDKGVGGELDCVHAIITSTTNIY